MQYRILDCNMERLEKKLNRIKNKCVKYGNEFSYEVIGEEYKEIQDNDNVEIRHYYIIEASGTAIVNGWKFIGTIDHTEEGNIFHKATEDEIPERYYNCKPYCEHCGKIRSRKDSFIVMNTKTNEFKQVGRNCLCDYTAGLSAENAACYISMYDELIKGEAPYGGGHYTSYIERDTILEIMAECIRKLGFVPSSEYGNSTRSKATRFYNYFYRRSYLMDKEVEEIKKEIIQLDFKIDDSIKQKVKDALEWISNQSEDNNFIHNLKTVCKLEYVTYDNFGLLAALFPTYDKDLERQYKERKKLEANANEAAKSNYVGKVKDRITINVAETKVISSWETEWGYTVLNKIVDTDGNVFIWKTSHGIDENTKQIIGTVIEQSEYNGVKQNKISRCKEVA